MEWVKAYLIAPQSSHQGMYDANRKKQKKNPNNTQTNSNSEKLRLGLVLNSKEFREL
jgi:hypothetical protein